MKNAAAVVGGVLVLAGIAGILALRDRGDDSAPPTPEPSPSSRDAPAVPDGPPIEILCRRSTDEILVFARRREFGRPAIGLDVRLLDAAGTVLRIGRTDEFGVLRSSLPADAVQVAYVGDGSGTCVTSFDLPPAPPPAPPSPLPILADRAAVHPGETLRFCVWAEGRPDGVLTFEPAEQAVDPVEFSRVEELQPGFPGPRKRWIVLDARVPGDVRPGTAIATIGGTRLEIPILPLWNLANEGKSKGEIGPFAVRSPDRTSGEMLKVEPLAGAWRVECREEFSVALLYATSGDRFLTHGAVPGEGREALTALFIEGEEPAAQYVHAIVSTGRRFLEASVPVPEASAAPRRIRVEPEPRVGTAAAEDRIRAFVEEDGRTVPAAIAVAVAEPSGWIPEAFLVTEETVEAAFAPLALGSGGDRHVRVLAIPRDGGPPLRTEITVLGTNRAGSPRWPVWIYEEDVLDGFVQPPSPLPTRPTLLTIRRVLRPGEPLSLAEPGIAVPMTTPVTWLLSSAEEPTSVRVRAGDEILLETSTEEPGSAKLGAFEAARIGHRPVLLESPAADVRLTLIANVPVRAAEVTASEPDVGTGLVLSREMPAKIAVSSTAEFRVRIAAASVVEQPFVVCLPLPRGAMPHEDGWSVRERAPEGTRVEISGDVVEWRLPRLEPGTTLSIRVRFPWRGRFVAPSATILGSGPPYPTARTAGAVVVVE